MKLISNSMHWAWKVAFVLSAVWLIAGTVEAVDSYYPTQQMVLAMLFPAVWVTIRWISIGKEADD